MSIGFYLSKLCYLRSQTKHLINFHNQEFVGFEYIDNRILENANNYLFNLSGLC